MNPWQDAQGLWYFKVGPYKSNSAALAALLKYIVWKDRTPWQRFRVLLKEFWHDTRSGVQSKNENK